MAVEVLVKDGPSTPRPKDVKELPTLTQVRAEGAEAERKANERHGGLNHSTLTLPEP